MEKKGRPASPATALASRVLPVPGGPISSAPFGSRPPRRVNFCGSFRNSMISCSSTLASSAPGHVGEGDLRRVAREQLRLGLAEAKARLAARLQLAQQEEPEAENHDPGQRGEQEGDDRSWPPARMGTPALLQPLLQLLACSRREAAAVKFLAETLSRATAVRNSPLTRRPSNTSTVATLPGIELAGELGVGELGGRRSAAGPSSARGTGRRG